MSALSKKEQEKSHFKPRPPLPPFKAEQKSNETKEIDLEADHENLR